ncbi:LacI family DNA-binding transcriptional regulator [Sinomonas sp. ASV322]|uniref:LacI family DNA-binding transcriptional regulator n=1 Tax=Sinomonas sp. ASV322 TaxID=3041920 RepID=UPI0027DDEC36|nr:LacI family DNA-binding transcriptional regulator [Sinomonas sp. ASV322]MDQ4503983.1 LacI family DNA-binding transcriptional regulator [Sinomonas sp. ASV322]
MGVSIRDVAETAGVSMATVSRALSGRGNVSQRSRERVLDAAEKLGFVPSYNASSLASGRTRNIGVMLPSVSRWFFSSVLEGASKALLEAGYDLTLYNTGEQPGSRESVLNDFLLRQRLDGLLAVSLELSSDEVDQLMRVKRPVVGVGGLIAGVATLQIDDFEVARAATQHLIGLGHRDIAHVSGTAEFERDFALPTSRREGFLAAMKDAGLEVRSSWLAATDFTVSGAYSASKRLLASPGGRPTAIFAASDEMAFGAILAARDLGLRVPDDVSIIGIDGHDLGPLFGLTTFDQAPRKQGETAVRMLLGQVEGDGAEAHSGTIEPEFVVRSSTAAPKAARRA